MKPHVSKALICTAVAFAAAVAALYFSLGPPSREGGAEAMGRLFALAGMAGLICGWVARSGNWGWPKFVGTYLAICIGLLVLTSYSRVAHAAEGASAPSLSLSVKWPAGWNVQHLQGASSDPRDQRLGFRERAVLGDTTPPRAVMEFSCVDAGNVPPSPRAALQSVLDGTKKGFEAQGMTVSVEEPKAVSIGARAGAAATITMKLGDFTLVQNVGVAPGDDCLLTANLAGSAEEYRGAENAFKAARASVRLVKP